MKPITVDDIKSLIGIMEEINLEIVNMSMGSGTAVLMDRHGKLIVYKREASGKWRVSKPRSERE